LPEGDSIHRQASEIGARLIGHAVTALYARGAAYPALIGQTVTSVVAQGKHLLIDVGPRARLHVHLGMSGRVQILPRAELTATRAARASLALAAGDAAVIWSAAPTVEVLRTAFAHAHPVLRRLGPDLLGADFDVAAAVARARQRPPTMTLGELLLDQRVAAGIGNIYKSEALFLEKHSPWTPIARLDDAQLAAIYTRARALMQASLGPTPRTTAADRWRGGWGPRGRGRYNVYRRRHAPCPACGAPIAMAYQGTPARSSYYCPRCQPRTSAPP
jgi:endonuclease-8